MKLSFYGHACFSVEINGKHLLFDPFISGNPNVNENLRDEVKTVDYIFVSHAHFDHITDVEYFAKRDNAIIISNWEIVAHFENLGLNGHKMNIGGHFSIEDFTAKMVVAQHSSSFPDGKYGGNPSGFVVSSSSRNFYYTGDTSLTFDMKLIAEEFKLDFAVLPIGDNFTMGVKDAIKAAKMVNCDTVVGVHYDTFDAICINHTKAKQDFKQAGVNLHLLDLGQTIDL